MDRATIKKFERPAGEIRWRTAACEFRWPLRASGAGSRPGAQLKIFVDRAAGSLAPAFARENRQPIASKHGRARRDALDAPGEFPRGRNAESSLPSCTTSWRRLKRRSRLPRRRSLPRSPRERCDPWAPGTRLVTAAVMAAILISALPGRGRAESRLAHMEPSWGSTT